ncbi:hypothetical protein [Allosphingosinicella sp.]|jgi:hypothetical protein|uniref:hypothetical protein n=1 Tax=Allosphingosinicella sp. TaxID=2823234 RepID=UPI002F1F237C
MSTKPTPGAGDTAPLVPIFDPVPVRYRRDGWTPERQVAFIRAIAECGCVLEACRRVGMSSESAYELARRPDAQSFRVAWDYAMDNAVRRLGDAAFSRAINGVEIPHFYKGELVGTHRRYDERLTMFILRTRDPLRFGAHVERGETAGSREGKALGLADALAWVRSDASREASGLRRVVIAPEAGNDDEEGAPARSLRHVHDFAPATGLGSGNQARLEEAESRLAASKAGLRNDEPGDQRSDEPDDEDEQDLEDELDEEQAAALEEQAWAALRESALACARAEGGPSEAEIEATIVFARSRSAPPLPPHVPPASSTSGAVDAVCPASDRAETGPATAGPPPESTDPRSPLAQHSLMTSHCGEPMSGAPEDPE